MLFHTGELSSCYYLYLASTVPDSPPLAFSVKPATLPDKTRAQLSPGKAQMTQRRNLSSFYFLFLPTLYRQNNSMVSRSKNLTFKSGICGLQNLLTNFRGCMG